MNKLTIAFLLGFVSLLGVTACGSDDDDEGSASQGVAACQQFCTAYEGAACEAYSAGDTCESWEGCTDTAGAPAACDSAVKAYYDCKAGQADICVQDTACGTELNAMMTACSG